MALINAETKLCDVILHEPSVIPVINRFGIILGVGDKSIRTVCEEKSRLRVFRDHTQHLYQRRLFPGKQAQIILRYTNSRLPHPNECLL